MKITQIAPYVNAALKETLGENAATTDDLSNIVDSGETLEKSNLMDTFTKGLMNQVGKMIFVERPYSGIAPSVLVDGSEYGSIVAKFSADLPEAQDDQSWSLTDGATYPPVFYATEVHNKMWNSTDPYEFRRSRYYEQLKQSFRSAEEMARFVSMLDVQVQNAATMAIDNTIRATINNFIGETLHDLDAGGGFSGKSGVRAINLLYLYNNGPNAGGTALTAQNCIHNPEFIRYAIFIINLVKDRMHGMNTLYNLGGQPRFTSDDRMKTVLLAQFADAAGVFLYDGVGQFKTDNLGLGTIEKVPYWQAVGTTFDTDLAFNEASAINIKTSENNNVSASGILGVVFDRDALGVWNERQKVRTEYSAAGDFYTAHFGYRKNVWNDFNEQFCVFYVA